MCTPNCIETGSLGLVDSPRSARMCINMYACLRFLFVGLPAYLPINVYRSVGDAEWVVIGWLDDY